MIPPMEIIARCRAFRVLESFEEAGSAASVAFNVVLVGTFDCGQNTPERARRRLLRRHALVDRAELEAVFAAAARLRGHDQLALLLAECVVPRSRGAFRQVIDDFKRAVVPA